MRGRQKYPTSPNYRVTQHELNRPTTTLLDRDRPARSPGKYFRPKHSQLESGNSLYSTAQLLKGCTQHLWRPLAPLTYCQKSPRLVTMMSLVTWPSAVSPLRSEQTQNFSSRIRAVWQLLTTCPIIRVFISRSSSDGEICPEVMR